jgi:hypothetical protein
MIEKYLISLQDTLNKGDAREESFYVHLENLIKDFAKASQIKNLDITILPKKPKLAIPTSVFGMESIISLATSKQKNRR